MAPRGPDDEGYVLIDTRSGRAVPCRGTDTAVPGLADLDTVPGEFDLALGHRRLAIVDQSAHGHQPMASSDGRRWVVFNGMIYNFPELRRQLEQRGARFRGHSDTEVLLAAYDAWGRECVSRLNGMWSLVLWDGVERSLFVSRDRLGIKPMVYTIDGRRCAIASELGALVALSRLDGGPDRQALHHYLSLMEVPPPHTIYSAAYKLEPGRNLQVDRHGKSESRYWNPRVSAEFAGTEDDAERELEALLSDSVALRLRGDVSFGAFASGGVDSSLIAALASDHSRSEQLVAYTASVPDQPEADESEWAAMVAHRLGAIHQRVELRARDLLEYLDGWQGAEPFAVSSVLGVGLIARAARDRSRVLLAGDGADEILAGYTARQTDVDAKWDEFGHRGYGRWHPKRARAAAQPVGWCARDRERPRYARLRSLRLNDQAGRDLHVARLRSMFNDQEKRALYASGWAACFATQDTSDWLVGRNDPPGDDRLRRRQITDVETLLHDEMTAKLDRGTMAFGVEGRVPFLDHRVVEFCLSLPASYRYREERGKWLLRRIARRRLPEETISRQKRGFTMPIQAWLLGDLREFMRDRLSRGAVARGGIFDPDAVESLIDYFAREPNFHTAHMVLTLLCFQVWQDRQREGTA